MATFLAGDIGATKSLLSIYEGESNEPLLVQQFVSANYKDFDTLLADFLGRAGVQQSPISSACFAIAGPVGDDAVRLTNLPWEIIGGVLRKKFMIERLTLINDTQAAAYGLSKLDTDEMQILQKGRIVRNDTQLVLGAGTGLGIATLISNSGQQIVLPSEGGHMDFAPRDEFERGFLNYLAGPLGRVTQEDVLSGKGLVRIFNYIKSQSEPHPSIANNIVEPDASMSAEISRLAASRECQFAVEALMRFTRIYGAIAGNVALLCLPKSGVYITGGIAPKIAAEFASGTFIQSFNDNPRMGEVLQDIPVRLVLNPKVSLYGAQWLARTRYQPISTGGNIS